MLQVKLPLKAIIVRIPSLCTLPIRLVLNLHFVEERFEEHAHLLKAYFFVSLQFFAFSLSGFRMDEVKPILLITVMQLGKVCPVSAHHFLVVVLNEGFEDFRLLNVARVDLGKQSID